MLGEARYALARTDRGQELVEMRERVVRARGSFGMILDAEHREAAMTNPLDRAVVQIYMGNLEVGRASDAAFVALDRKSVILRGNEHSPGSHLSHRMVPSPVAVRELRRGSAERKAQ